MKITRIILPLMLTALSARAGNETRNGGDYLASQFYGSAENIVNAAVASTRPVYAVEEVDSYGRVYERMQYGEPTMSLGGIDLNKLKKALYSMRVVSTDETLLGGVDNKPRSAINIPESMLIKFNSDQWINSMGEPKDQLEVVAHELATLAKLETSDNYAMSRWLLNVLYSRRYTPERLRAGIDEGLGKALEGIYSCVYAASGQRAVDVSIQNVDHNAKKLKVHYPDWNVQATLDVSFGKNFEYIDSGLSCAYDPPFVSFQPRSSVRTNDSSYHEITAGALKGKKLALDSGAARGLLNLRVIGRNKIRLVTQGCVLDPNPEFVEASWQNRLVKMICTKQ